MTSGADPGVRDARERWILVSVLAVALLLRLRGFVSFALEGDEMYTFFEATRLFATNLQPGIEARPLYYLLQHAVFWVAPDADPVTLRALPLLFGMAGVWATWRLGREVAGPVAGLSAAAMAAVSPWHIYVSGMARYWSLVYLLACLAFWRLIVADRTDRLADWILVLGLTVAGLLSHPTFLFPVAGCGLALLLSRRRDGGWRLRWPTRNSMLGLWLPLAALLVVEFAVLSLTGNSGAVRNWSGRGWPAVARLIPAMVQWMTPVVFAAGMLGAVVAVVCPDQDGKRGRWGWMALVGTAVTMGLMVSAALSTDVYADYGLSALPLFLVSAGVLVDAGARVTGRWGRKVAVVSVLVLVAGVAPTTASHLSDGTRFDYRPAFDAIRREGADVPVYLGSIVHQRWYAPELDGHELSYRPEEMEARMADEEAWIVVGVRRYGIPGDPDGAFRRWLSGRCVLVQAHQGLRFDVRLYRVELHRCAAGQK